MTLNERLLTTPDLFEYLLVAYPTKKSTKAIGRKEQEKQWEPDAFITVATILAKEQMEETFIRWIQNICNLQKTFTVTFNNDVTSPCKNLQAQEAERFSRLANALKILDGFMLSNGCPAPDLVIHPRLTFVNGKSEKGFDHHVELYTKSSCPESFKVDKLALLKRDAQMKYNLVNIFTLPDRP